MAAKRKATGKRLRFEVFKRDHFTCQYCGAQPPGTVLVTDHITPVAEGGASTIDNLITACEPCNQGKAGQPLGMVAIRPDADLLYLETQQEVAELRRYQDALALKETAMGEIVSALQDLWCDLSGLDWAPVGRIIRSLIDRHSPHIAEAALRDVAPKVAGDYISGNWVGYLFAVARKMEEEA
jgi:hypothetical protein